MNSFINKETGAPVQAVQFEGDGQIFPGLKLEPIRETVTDNLWGHLQTTGARYPLYIGSWIVKNLAGTVMAYNNGDFQLQFEPASIEPYRRYAAALVPKMEYAIVSNANVDEARVREIVQDEIRTWWNRQMSALRANGPIIRDHEVK